MLISDSMKGYLCVMIAAVFWASSGTMGKALFDSGLLPTDLVQIRVTLASLFLAAGFILYNTKLFEIHLRDLPQLFFLGGVIMALVQVTYFYAISQIQVVAAILLQYMSPVLVAIYSMLFWGEKSNASRIAALSLSIIGCYLVVGGYNLELLKMNRLGIFAGIAAAFSYAVYALLGEKAMHKYQPWTVVFYSLAFAAVTWQFIHPPFKFMGSSYSAGQWLGILYIVVFGTILPFGFYFTGINFLRSTRAMITATLEPISAGIMAFVFLGEKLELLQLIGAALVLGAIVLLQINRENDEMAPHTIRRSENLRA